MPIIEQADLGPQTCKRKEQGQQSSRAECFELFFEERPKLANRRHDNPGQESAEKSMNAYDLCEPRAGQYKCQNRCYKPSTLFFVFHAGLNHASDLRLDQQKHCNHEKKPQANCDKCYGNSICLPDSNHHGQNAPGCYIINRSARYSRATQI